MASIAAMAATTSGASKSTSGQSFAGDASKKTRKAMPKLVIFGSGRGADVAARYFASDSDFEVSGFAVDKPYLTSDRFRGLPLVDFDLVENGFQPSDFRLFVRLGFQKIKGLC